MNPELDLLLRQVGQTPLETILDIHELTPRTDGVVVHYEGEKTHIIVAGSGIWFDNVAGVGGRGPVDLVLHLVQGVEPRRATDAQKLKAADWIADFDPAHLSPAPPPPGSAEAFEEEASRRAVRDDNRWPMARRYLIDSCRVPPITADILQGEQVYASYDAARPERTDLCFLRRDLDGAVTAATLQSLVDPREAPRTLGDLTSCFTLNAPGANRLIVTESPLDAISYLVLNRPEKATILALPLARLHEVHPALLEAAHARGREVTIAFGNAPSAHTGYARCRRDWQERFGEEGLPKRIAPLGSTWSDDLRAAKTLCRDHHW